MKPPFFLLAFLFSGLVFSQDWAPTYADALRTAKATKKPLILVFSGSDWCAPCIKLDKAIWKSQEFVAYSKDNFVLYRADFPKKKENKLSENRTRQNSKLADTFNRKGYFPLVLVLNQNEEILGTTGYKKSTPTKYIAHLNSFIK